MPFPTNPDTTAQRKAAAPILGVSQRPAHVKKCSALVPTNSAQLQSASQPSSCSEHTRRDTSQNKLPPTPLPCTRISGARSNRRSGNTAQEHPHSGGVRGVKRKAKRIAQLPQLCDPLIPSRRSPNQLGLSPKIIPCDGCNQTECHDTRATGSETTSTHTKHVVFQVAKPRTWTCFRDVNSALDVQNSLATRRHTTSQGGRVCYSSFMDRPTQTKHTRPRGKQDSNRYARHAV